MKVGTFTQPSESRVGNACVVPRKLPRKTLKNLVPVLVCHSYWVSSLTEIKLLATNSLENGTGKSMF